MNLQIVYINNDNDIFLKKCAFIKRLEKNNILFSDRLISNKTGLIFVTIRADLVPDFMANNKDLLKLYDNGNKKAVVIA